MNNAENHAAVEIKRKAAKEDTRYDLIERGESAKRNFEKFDKPHDEEEEKHQRTADSLTSLPPEDLRNVGVLALLCIEPF
jgi:seryl-tRNA synthetase